MTLSDIFGSREEEAARAVWPDLARQAGLDPEAHRLGFLLRRVSRDEIRILLSVDGPGGPLLVKHAPNLGADWFDRQVASHRQAWAAFEGAEGLGVPKLLVADPERRAFLMERVPGPTAHDALAEVEGRLPRNAILRACGRWLGHLHRSSEAQFCRYQARDTLRQIRSIRWQVEEGDRAVAAPETFFRLADAARDVAQAAGGRRTIQRPAHGDMHLANLMVEPGGRIMGIDFCKTERDYPARDLAYLLIHYITYFGSEDRTRLRAELEDAREVVLDGYDGRWRDSSILTPLIVVELLRIWKSVGHDPMRRSRMQAHRWQRIQSLTDLVLDEGL
ncbi:MAG: aminoglycoside phosphotransferase family protein [Pseudomonadota bacterium]